MSPHIKHIPEHIVYSPETTGIQGVSKKCTQKYLVITDKPFKIFRIFLRYIVAKACKCSPQCTFFSLVFPFSFVNPFPFYTKSSSCNHNQHPFCYIWECFQWNLLNFSSDVCPRLLSYRSLGLGPTFFRKTMTEQLQWTRSIIVKSFRGTSRVTLAS